MFKKCIYLDVKCLPISTRNGVPQQWMQQRQAAAMTHYGGDPVMAEMMKN